MMVSELSSLVYFGRGGAHCLYIWWPLTLHGAYLWYREWTGSDFSNPGTQSCESYCAVYYIHQLGHPVDPTDLPSLQNRSLKVV